MKQSSRYQIKAGKIRSLKDLEVERQRLRLEIFRAEEHIQSNYRHLLHSLSPKNIANNLLGNTSTTTGILGKAFTFGKAVMAKRKKKKKHSDSEDIGLSE